MREIESHYDAVIIGAGISGLTLGALLGRFKKMRVLVVEKHAAPGGSIQVFKRKAKYEFDIGMHYLANMWEGSPLRTQIDLLTDGTITWQEFPNQFDHVFFEDNSYVLSNSKEQVLRELVRATGVEEMKLRRFFAMLSQGESFYSNWQLKELLPSPFDRIYKWYLKSRDIGCLQTTESVLKKVFGENDLLMALLTRHWPALGKAADQSSFGYYSAVCNPLFFSTSVFPIGGAGALTSALVKTLESHGGKLLLRSRVESIDVSGGCVEGVTFTRRNQKYQTNAKWVISSAGAYVTYCELLGRSVPELKTLVSGATSYVGVYLGLNRSPYELGLDRSNYWIYKNEKFDPLIERGEGLPEITNLYVSSPSLKRGSDHHTIEILSNVERSEFSQWENTRFGARPEGYLAMKEKLYNRILEMALQHFPALREAIEFYEVSTPATVGHYLTDPLGVPGTPARLLADFNKCQTPVENLFLTGAETYAFGIDAALGGAYKTFLRMEEKPSLRLFQRARGESATRKRAGASIV